MTRQLELGGEPRPCEWCMAAPATCIVIATRCCNTCKANRATRVAMALQRWGRNR